MIKVLRLGLFLFFFLPFILVGTPDVYAAKSCYYNGTWYPDGTIIGDRVCDNGRWVRY
jgi:hypothetical protein